MTKLRRNKKFIVKLNVDLTNYIHLMQNAFDCVYYEQNYDFPFLFEYEETFKKHVE